MSSRQRSCGRPSTVGQASDLYRVRLKRPNATLDGYFIDPPKIAWQPALENFSPVANRNIGEPIELTVAVLSGGGTCAATSTFKTVDALSQARLLLGPGEECQSPGSCASTSRKGQLVDFMPNPGACLACHGVTRDGRRMGAHNDSIGAVGGYDLTANLTASPPPRIFEAAKGRGERISVLQRRRHASVAQRGRYAQTARHVRRHVRALFGDDQVSQSHRPV